MPRKEDVVKPKVYKICGRRKKLKECGKGDPRQVETAKASAPPKSTGHYEGQQHGISRQKNEVLKPRKLPLNCGYLFQERGCDGEADRNDTIRLLECGHDIVIVLESRRTERWQSSVLHDDGKGGPAVEILPYRRSTCTEQPKAY